MSETDRIKLRLYRAERALKKIRELTHNRYGPTDHEYVADETRMIIDKYYTNQKPKEKL